jgi:peroxiredoxin
MKKYIKIIIFGIIALLFISGGFYFIRKYILPEIFGTVDLGSEAKKALPGENLLGKRAPEFNLPNVLGSRTTLSQFFGIPTILVFWATWNKESADEIQIVDRYMINQKEQSSLVNIVSINSQEDRSIASSFIKRGGYSLVSALDTFEEVSNSYNIKTLPTIYFISRSGVVKEVHTGLLSENTFVEKVDSLLKQKGVE